MLSRAVFTMAVFVLVVEGAAGQSLEERVTLLEAQVAELWQVVELGAVGGTMVPAVLVGNQHLRWGYPGGKCTLLVTEYFVTCHDEAYRIPEWVAYRLTAKDMEGEAERTNDFRVDPRLPEGERAELADYRGSGYDRGHMAPAAAFKRSDEAMLQTFVLSNMAPQTPALNRQLWRLLEEDVRGLASESASIWVFTGSLFANEDGSLIEPKEFIGENRVAVPTHFYKVILADTGAFAASAAHSEDRTNAANAPALLAFTMPNQHQPLEGTPADYIVAVDLVESLSGLDFFSTLPDSVEAALEKQTNTSWWTR